MATTLEITSTLPFHTGGSIPIFGFGTCASRTATESALAALRNSYRHLDDAQIYKNEAEVGKAIAESKVNHSELFVCSKLWEDMYTRDGAVAGVQGSLKKLGLETLDLYLLHNPRPGPKARTEAWLGLQDAKKKGLVKNIGVSNWAPKHFDLLMKQDGVTEFPVCNQVEFHPWNQQREIRKWCKSKGVVVVAYSPLTQGTRLKEPTILKIADKYHKTPAQIVLRWCLQSGVVVIPKSDKEERIIENKGIFGWELAKEDMETIDGLDEGQKGNVGEWDPFAYD